MKKYYIILLACCLTWTSYSQRGSKESRAHIKAFKIAHITEALSLTKAEAEKFWPIYNASAARVSEIKYGKSKSLHKKMREEGGIDAMSDSDANQMLAGFTEVELKLAKEKQEFYKELKGVISSKKTLKLVRAEHSFSRELLRKFRGERKEIKKE